MRFVYICTVTSQTNGVTRLFIWLQIYSEILLWQGRIFHLTSMFRKVFRRILFFERSCSSFSFISLFVHSIYNWRMWWVCTKMSIHKLQAMEWEKIHKKPNKIDIKWLNPVWSSWSNEWKLRWVSSISDQYYHIQHLNSQRNSIVFSFWLAHRSNSTCNNINSNCLNSCGI